MKHLKRFNEEVKSDFQQDDDRVWTDDFDRLVSFTRKNESDILEFIEFWETSHGRKFNEIEFNNFVDKQIYGEDDDDDDYWNAPSPDDDDEDYLGEGKTEKAVKTGDKHTEVKPDKKTSMRKSIGDHIKSLECKTKQIGDDFEIHLDDKHIADVMFRKDYIAVKKVGNKFPKEFEYTELGKIKSEITSIIKSCKN